MYKLIMYSRGTNKKISKNRKSNYKTKLNRIKKIQQTGGVNNIQEFIDELITRNNTIDLPKDFNYDKPKENTYYSRLLQILPCSLRMRDALGQRGRRLMKYKFNNELTKTDVEVLIQDENFWGEHNTIVCSKLPSGEET